MESAPHPKQQLYIDLGVELDRFDIFKKKRRLGKAIKGIPAHNIYKCVSGVPLF